LPSRATGPKYSFNPKYEDLISGAFRQRLKAQQRIVEHFSAADRYMHVDSPTLLTHLALWCRVDRHTHLWIALPDMLEKRSATRVSTGALNKMDLIQEVSRVVEGSLKDGEAIVDQIFGSIVRALQAGDKVEIRGFGSFHTRQRKARIARNPKTGASVSVPPKKVPFFKPSKDLKQLVNSGSESL
jgi:integration host factor subunit beta